MLSRAEQDDMHALNSTGQTMTAAAFLGFSLPLCVFYKHVPLLRRLQNYRIGKYVGLAVLLVMPSNVVSSVY